MAKVYNIGGVECNVIYKRDYNETFIHPTRKSGQWEGNEFKIVSDLCIANGRDVCGGHEYYIAVVGNIRKLTLTRKQEADIAALCDELFGE